MNHKHTQHFDYYEKPQNILMSGAMAPAQVMVVVMVVPWLKCPIELDIYITLKRYVKCIMWTVINSQWQKSGHKNA